MVARLIDENPELAHQHAISAARRAGRIGVVRETLAITAYATGDFGLALRELRTYRRITGRDDQLPMMVDSERGLGRPDRALELARSVDRRALPAAVQVELAIAMSGARLDQGQPDAALGELQIAQLDPNTAYSYSPALFDAYAVVLEELGRTDEAAEWYARSKRAAEALESAQHPDGDEGIDEVIEILEEEVELDDSDIGIDVAEEFGDDDPADADADADVAIDDNDGSERRSDVDDSGADDASTVDALELEPESYESDSHESDSDETRGATGAADESAERDD